MVRSDRSVREGGGVISYVKDHLTISDEFSDSDSINDLLCLYINEINLALVTIYRPPDSTKESFSWCVRSVNGWLRKIQKKHDGVRLFINGDFNLRKLHDWSEDSINLYRDKINDRINKKESIGIESTQMLEVIDFADR